MRMLEILRFIWLRSSGEPWLRGRGFGRSQECSVLEMLKGVTVVFSGHRVNAPDRAVERFPPRLSEAAGARIKSRVTPDCVGFSSAANGGDILFIEACLDVGTEVSVLLPFAPEIFLARSVATAAPRDWEARFWQIWEKLDPAFRYVLHLNGQRDPFSACFSAQLDLAEDMAQETRVLLLWDGQEKGHPGGTTDMACLAQDRGLPINVIAPGDLV